MWNAGRYQWLTSCTGIELRILPDQSFVCKYCTISIDKEQLAIENKGDTIGDFADILKHLPRERPVALVLSGKGVLIKKGSKTDNETLSYLFPAIKAEDFYIQRFTSGDCTFNSIIRQETTDSIINKLMAAGLTVLAVSLGPFTVSHVVEQLNHYGDELIFDGHSVRLSNGEWADYRYEEGLTSRFPVKLDIESIDEKYLLAYSAAFQLALYERLLPIQLTTSSTGDALAEYKEKKKFGFRLTAVLAGFFVLLLLNFVLFSYYNDENERLAAQVSESNSAVTNSALSIQELQGNEKLLKEIGWHKGIRKAFILDQLGSSLPVGITLNNLLLNADSKEGNVNNELRRIRISGHAGTASMVSSWIYILREMDWINEVKLDLFEPDRENSGQKFQLTISY